jgi:hypothetical protein
MSYRSFRFGWLVTGLLLAGCSADPVGLGPDGQVNPDATADAAAPLPDGAVPADARPPLDGGVYCAEPLLAGAVIGTEIAPSEPTPQTFEYLLEGEATYHGAITEPLAMNPAFDHELQLLHSDGTVSIIQYYLPLDLTMPIAIGGGYTARYRQVIGFEGNATGLVISRMTSGVAPLVLVLDLGEYGRAFEPEDLAMSPLEVHEAGALGCSAGDPQGAGASWGSSSASTAPPARPRSRSPCRTRPGPRCRSSASTTTWWPCRR